jgi:tetratricopeptide (TPR) repeat protein
MKHHDKAVRQLNYALEVETDGFESGKIWNNIGNVYLAQGKLEQALQSYQSAIQQAPSFPLAHSNRGLVYSQMGEYEKALADFEKAVQLNPDWDFAKQQHEKTQETIAQRLHVKKAIVQYKSDLKKSPHNTTLLNQLAGSYLFLGDQEKAVEYWEKVLAVEANSADILNNLAFIYVQKNTPQSDPDKALVYAQKACRLTEHQNPNYLDTLALAHASLGDFQQALDLSHQALTLAVSQNQMGLIQTLQKNIEQYEKRMLP